jgi:hypothetical protein
MGVEPERQFPPAWRKSSYSSQDAGCVEVASTVASVLVRDSRDRKGPTIQVTPTQWYLLLGRIQRAHLDCG